MVGDRADAMLEAMDEARHEGNYRRIEVITGRRKRRDWTPEEKERILGESAGSDVNISAVARRWGVNRGLLNTWRREAGLTRRRGSGQATPCRETMFVPLTVVGDLIAEQAGPEQDVGFSIGRIEIEIAGARMTVTGSVSPELAQAMIKALRSGR